MMKLYKPREFSQDDVDLLEELIFSQRLFPIKKTTQSIRFLLSLEPDALADAFTLFFKSGEEFLSLVLKPSSGSNFSKLLLQYGGEENIPHDFLLALRAFLSRQIIDALEEFFQIPLSLIEEKEAKTDPRKKIYFQIIDEHSELQFQGAIEIPSSLFPKLITAARSLPRVERGDLASFTFQGEVLLGHTSISITELKKLLPGDLIFFHEPSAFAHGEGFFCFSHGEKIPLQLQSKQLEALIQPFKEVLLVDFLPAPLPERKEKIDPSAEELASPVEEIELTFSAGTLSLSMEEINQLVKTKKLSQLPLQKNPMKLLVQRTLVGTGSLVEIHGQHALFLTQLNLKNEC